MIAAKLWRNEIMERLIMIMERLIIARMRATDPNGPDRRNSVEALVAIVRRMTAEKPEDRPASARDVAGALTGWKNAYAGRV